MAEPSGKRLVLCPECDTEVNLNDVDDCPKCGLNVQRVIDKDRYDRALVKLRERREAEQPRGKKSSKDYDPFA